MMIPPIKRHHPGPSPAHCPPPHFKNGLDLAPKLGVGWHHVPNRAGRKQCFTLSCGAVVAELGAAPGHRFELQGPLLHS